MKTYDNIKETIGKLNALKVQINKDGQEILLNALKENGGEIELDYEYEETVCISYDGDGHEWEANPYSAVSKVYLDNETVMVDFEEDCWGFSALSTDEQVNLLEVVFEKTLPRLAKEKEEE